jgi:hypothetical protein
MNELFAIRRKKNKLPAFLVDRVIDFALELDALTTKLQPPGSTRLLDTHLVLFLDPKAADADGGYEILTKVLEKFSADEYNMTSSDAQQLITLLVLVALHISAHALHADTLEDAIDLLSDAREMRGFANGVIWNGDDSMVRAELARRGAKAANSVYDLTKKNVFAWCDEHFAGKRSLEAAASEVMHIERISLVTARKYIKEWKAQIS